MRRRIMVLVVGMTALVLVAVAVPIAILIGKEVVDRGKRDTVQQASVVGNYLSGGATRAKAQIATYVAEHSEDGRRPISVLCEDGTLIGTLSEAAGVGGNVPQFDGRGRGDGGPGVGDPGGDDVPRLNDVANGVVAVLRTGQGDHGYLVRVY
ncbi:MAG: hypothetical protein ABR571_12840, partial [Jatrophihabitans sp.]